MRAAGQYVDKGDVLECWVRAAQVYLENVSKAAATKEEERRAAAVRRRLEKVRAATPSSRKRLLESLIDTWEQGC